MRVQINKEGRTRYKRKFFFPDSKEVYIRDRIRLDGYNSRGEFRKGGMVTEPCLIAEMPFKTLSIACRCPHCGLQMYAIWYRDEQFIAKTKEAISFKPDYYLPTYNLTFKKLWDLAKREQKAYAETSKRIEAEICYVRAMERCPICGEMLSQKQEDTTESSCLPSDYFIECTFKDLVYNYKDYPSISYSDAIQNIRNSAVCQEVDIDKKKIANDSDVLQKYIKHLLNTEMTVQLLEKRLITLYSSSNHYREKYIRQQAEEMSVIAEAQYSSINVIEPTINDVVLSETAPIKPHFIEKQPVEPQYEKPGFLNKKKIQAQNELLRSKYEADCQAYHRKKAEYDILMNEYRSALDLYDKKRQEAFACLLNEHKRKEEARRAAFLANINRTKSEIMEQLGTYVLYQETLKEIQRTEELYSQSYACLQSLYSCGVVYEKYRNPVALASFYDYLAAGRCTTLTGADGAYNIYEGEVRMDRIITKLDVVIRQLEEIKNNQYSLYSVMSEMNASINTLSKTASAMEDSLSEIKGYQKNISDNTAVISHNTAVTAFYAKKTAELTNALGFMVALK